MSAAQDPPRPAGGVVCQPVRIPARPSAEYVATLREMGAPEVTIRLALGQRRRWTFTGGRPRRVWR